MLHAKGAVDNVDSAPLFRAIRPDETPAIEGRFDVDGQLSAAANAPGDLADSLQGECRLSSKGGRFRVLRTDALEPLRQAPSRLAGAVDTVTGLFGKKADKYAEAVVDSAGGLSEIRYDQMNIEATRGPDLDIHFTEISLIAPEVRISGSGTVTHVPAVPVGSQPFGADLELGVRGKLAALLGLVDMLKDEQDELGYFRLYQPVHLGGTLADIDQSQWREMLIRAPLRRAGGFV